MMSAEHAASLAAANAAYAAARRLEAKKDYDGAARKYAAATEAFAAVLTPEGRRLEGFCRTKAKRARLTAAR